MQPITCTMRPSPQEHAGVLVEITLEELREASGTGCPFCCTLYGALMDAPAWDPSRKVVVPKLPTIKLDYSLADGQYLGVNLFDYRDPALIFYINRDEGAIYL